MKIILLKDVKGVGKRFEEKNVPDGYAANFLIPKKLAVSISGASAGAVKMLKEQEEKGKEKREQGLVENIAKISGTTISIKMNANEQGHLFSSLSAEKISNLIKKEQGIEIDPELINIKEPIKEIGTLSVPISVAGGKETHFNLEVLRS